MSNTDSTTPETPVNPTPVPGVETKKKFLGFIPRPRKPKKGTVITAVTAFGTGVVTVLTAQRLTGETVDFQITTPEIDYDDGNGNPLDVPADS